MTPRIIASLSLAGMTLLLAGCDKLPGKPHADEQWKHPGSVTDFHKLYSQNCAGCHAIQPGQSAAARPLNDSLYLAYVGKGHLREIIANGVHGTTMPAFGPAHGGYLTEAQIDILAEGVMQAGGPKSETAAPLPAYAVAAGNPLFGKDTFAVFCASCHGPDGTGAGKIGSIVDPDYLSLVSDQWLRSLVVAGRPDLKHPDFAHYLPDRVMTAQEIADVVAWLASQRPAAH